MDYLIYAYLCSEQTEENPYAEQTCQPAVAETLGMCSLNGELGETTCREAAECEGLVVEETDVVACDGYVPAIEADTQVCACDDPIGTTSEATYTCNEEGTGYNDCNAHATPI